MPATPFMPLWMALLGLIFCCSAAWSRPRRRKTFPVCQFSYLSQRLRGRTRQAVEIGDQDQARDRGRHRRRRGRGQPAPGGSRHRTAAHQGAVQSRPVAAARHRPLGGRRRSMIRMATRCRRRVIGAGLRGLHAGARCRGRGRGAGHRRRQGLPSARYWRPALMAYKESLKLAENPELRETYETAAHRPRLPRHRLQGRQRRDTAARLLRDFGARLAHGDGLHPLLPPGARAASPP